MPLSFWQCQLGLTAFRPQWQLSVRQWWQDSTPIQMVSQRAVVGAALISNPRWEPWCQSEYFGSLIIILISTGSFAIAFCFLFTFVLASWWHSLLFCYFHSHSSPGSKESTSRRVTLAVGSMSFFGFDGHWQRWREIGMTTGCTTLRHNWPHCLVIVNYQQLLSCCQSASAPRFQFVRMCRQIRHLDDLLTAYGSVLNWQYLKTWFESWFHFSFLRAYGFTSRFPCRPGASLPLLGRRRLRGAHSGGRR